MSFQIQYVLPVAWLSVRSRSPIVRSARAAIEIHPDEHHVCPRSGEHSQTVDGRPNPHTEQGRPYSTPVPAPRHTGCAGRLALRLRRDGEAPDPRLVGLTLARDTDEA